MHGHKPSQYTCNTCGTVDRGTAPFDVAEASVADKVCEGIGGDGDRTGTNRQMRAWYADKIDHQRDGEYRATAAEEAEGEADQDAGQPSEQIL